MHPIFATTLLIAVATSFIGCTSRPKLSVPNAIKPYKSEVIQGNFIASEQVAALRTGMPRATVRNILGTPLLASVFHADRWDYIFTIERDNVVSRALRLTVHFEGDQLVRWNGDTMPSETEFVQTLTSGRQIGKVPPLAASEKDLAAFSSRENSKVKQTGGTDEPAANPTKTYPSLESK
jgi:outer membrane protein assembly factor BamE